MSTHPYRQKIPQLPGSTGSFDRPDVTSTQSGVETASTEPNSRATLANLGSVSALPQLDVQQPVLPFTSQVSHNRSSSKPGSVTSRSNANSPAGSVSSHSPRSSLSSPLIHPLNPEAQRATGSKVVSPNGSIGNLNEFGHKYRNSGSRLSINTSSSGHSSPMYNIKPDHRTSSRSVDLGSFYQLDRSVSPAITIGTNMDFSQSLLANQQTAEHPSALVPRMKTIEMYRKNARKSHDPAVLFQYAQYMLQTALLLDTESEEEGKLRKDFLQEAQHYLKKLADKGYLDAQYLLGDAYSVAAFGKTDDKESFSLFQSAAKHGHVECAYRTALCYEEGLGTGRNSRKAVEFLKFAASRNHAAAMYKMGLYSFYAKMGLPNNITTKKAGIQWLSRATMRATELTAAAPYELAKIHYHGFEDIVIPDRKYALELYVKAASLGHVKSAAILGHHYEVGDVIPQDPDLSIHYYNIAAMGGDCESMLAMCAWYLVGSEKLEKDENEAFEWAIRAAHGGLAKAQFAVSHFLEQGIGCEIDFAQSKVWLEKSAQGGNSRAITKLKNLNSSSENSTKDSKKDKDCIIM
ncbi:Chitin synthase III activator [Komagataella phaffii CBS 7435]|uniref:Activator of Chs3p (Chitin synthase III), recruits Chs3p to the bud neck via interaction with Bni4p n=2 Tax=Komagataella phaffii TaxID=460519 RepID=C4R049_KOMPG|nr:Activator of Chs3p (chitin synthase III), recruits Chs3p to the bud neck via interaction with Bni4p [Komagataella phaffii GS115]AOA62747.1 GQ67_00292T0 [Komagataella phaffii]CAH2448624.1 Chitin synthase III activator [Komagataella phaffii CBS 7435]AOA67302.1 GQ68_01097T0 [Komagataella phaffii GS115]CAY68873.1 Activator of Chs3p (chitin synthase III), recruits Chs3p to the bud neck via interaction with Bni4p [Komagataella phaffii GS115]CCA38723.1 Chitin synthase III activator [Komagataella p